MAVILILIIAIIHPIAALVVVGCWLVVNLAIVAYHGIEALMKEILK